MHFYTVGFVEYLELLGILIFYRVSFKRKISTADQSTVMQGCNLESKFLDMIILNIIT